MATNKSYNLVSKYRKEIMGFAAVCILIYHEWMLVFSNVPLVGKFESFFKIIGFFGVDIFFFLSAMGLVYARSKETLLVFYARRLKKILIPPIFLLIVLCIVGEVQVRDAFLDFFGYYFYARYIYTFLWFFTAIATVYLVFPLYFLLFSKFKNKIVFTGVVIIIWLVLSVLFSGTSRVDMYGFTNRIPIMALGVYYGWNKGWINREKSISPILHYIFLFFLLLSGLFLAWKTGINKMFLLVPISDCCIPNILLTLSVVPLLATVFERKIFKGIFVKAFGFLGTFTFELYCLQERMGSVTIPWLAERTPYPIVINIINFSVIILAAFLLHQLIELFFKYCDKVLRTRNEPTI